MDEHLRAETVRWQKKLFRRSVRRQTRLEVLKQLLGTVSGQSCLELSAGDAVISAALRETGGSWSTLTVNPAAQAVMDCVLGEPVPLLQGASLDMPDHTFDVVVLTDVLERVHDDTALIRECHRVLKTDGRLVLTSARRTPFCLGSSCPLRSVLGLSWRHLGLERPGYSTREFFGVLKDGFDVPETVSYSGCCIEIPGVLGEALANRLAGGPYTLPPPDTGTEEFYAYSKIYAIGSVFYPLMRLLAKLDGYLSLLFPGRNVAAKTKRRVWRARTQPILVDGRSIAEAAINTKIGTAAPF